MIPIPLIVAAFGAFAEEPCVDEYYAGECQVIEQLNAEDPPEAPPTESAMPTTAAPLESNEGPAPMNELETWVEETQYQGGQFFDREGTIVLPNDGSFTEDSYVIEIPAVSPPAPVEEPAPE